jgi:hypothetical protein
LNTITVNDRTRPYRSLDVHESPSSGYESFSGTPEAHEHQAEAHATRHHHYDASAQSHEQHHRASRPSYVSYMTLKRPGSPTTVGRTPGHHASTMLREAPICALQAEQVQRVGRSAAPTPHVLRPCMTGALPCCSHDVRQRVCAGGLARQPPKRDVEPPRLAWKWSFPCESEAGSEGKTDTPVVNLNPFPTHSISDMEFVRREPARAL